MRKQLNIGTIDANVIWQIATEITEKMKAATKSDPANFDKISGDLDEDWFDYLEEKLLEPNAKTECYKSGDICKFECQGLCKESC